MSDNGEKIEAVKCRQVGGTIDRLGVLPERRDEIFHHVMKHSHVADSGRVETVSDEASPYPFGWSLAELVEAVKRDRADAFEKPQAPAPQPPPRHDPHQWSPSWQQQSRQAAAPRPQEKPQAEMTWRERIAAYARREIG